VPEVENIPASGARFTPLARSPIAPAAPVIVSHGWEISGARSEAALRLVDCTPLAKLQVRAEPDGVAAEQLGQRFGRAGRDADGSLVIGSGPGEWLVVGACGSAEALAARVPRPARLVDLTHGRALLRLTGADAARLLAKLCPIDLDDRSTPDGAAFRSSVAKLVTDVVREDDANTPSYWLHCEWASGQYLFDALLDAGREFGIEVDGWHGA
jgi:heterotetrameric sarcosine oxidase gamma subunit